LSKKLIKFKGKIIPIIEWKFFKSIKDAVQIYNKDTFNGWNDSWQPIASNQFGDAVAINGKGNIGFIEHDTGEPAKFTLITRDITKLESTLLKLAKLPQYDEETPAEKLNKLLKTLQEIKRIAPQSIKEDISQEIEAIKDYINDQKDDEAFSQTKESTVIETLREYSIKMSKVIEKYESFGDVSINGRINPPAVTYIGTVTTEKDFKLLQKIAEEHPSPYEINFDYLKINSKNT